MVLAFPLVGKWTTWKVGNGRRIRTGQVSWVGSGDSYILTDSLFSKLKEKGISVLADASSYTDQSQRGTVWKSTQELKLHELDVPV